MMNTTPALRADKKAIAALLSVGLATFSLLYCTQPLLPVFSSTFHLSPAQSSWSVSISTIVLAITMLFAPMIALTVGKKRIMIFSMLSSSVCTLCIAACHTFTEIVILRGLLGLLIAGVPSLAMSLVREAFASKVLGRLIGIYIAGTTLGGMFGRIAVGSLTDLATWRTAIVVVALVGFVLTLICIWGLPNVQSSAVQNQPKFHAALAMMAEKLADVRLIGLYLIAFLLMGAFVTAYNYISYALLAAPYHLSQSQVGWIYSVYLTGTAASMWMGRLSDKHGRAIIVTLSAGLAIIGAAIMLSVPLWWKIIGLAIFTFGFFGEHSVASGWVTRRTTRGAATASSLYLLFYYLGSGCLGTVGGLFWSIGGWHTVVLFIGGLTILGLFVTAWVASLDKAARV